jgi:hypothetical protein
LTLLQQATENSKEGKTFRTKDQERTKKRKKTQKQYEEQCQSHTCSGTINSRINDRLLYHNFPTDLITSLQWVKASETLTCIPSFCCKSGSNRKTQPCYWLTTNNNTRRQQKTGRHNRIDKT